MALTLKNYATTLSPDLLLQAKKNDVRECDETEKGHFVAYVDDGNDSFDVSLTIKAGNEITAHTCECNSKSPFCRHKTALLIHITEGKKPKEAVKPKKKVSQTDALLDDADPTRLKEWVRSLISKNKDIELAFVHFFAVRAQLTPAEVTKIVNDAVKAVTGNKKAIDATQLKKLVELWDVTLTPVAEHYYKDVTGEKSFLNFHTMLDACVAFGLKIESSSNKISKFIDEALQKSVEPICNLKVEEAWDIAVGFFINHVPNGGYSIRMPYLNHLKNIIDASNEDRKIKTIDWLVKQLEKINIEKLHSGPAYCKFIFALTESHHLFAAYSRIFKPMRWENDYNQSLIRQLILNNDLNEAKQYCLAQVESNSKEEYNIPYLTLLKEILVIQKDDDALAKLLVMLLPYTLNFDDYLFVLKRLNSEEQKKWRTKMITRARNSNYSHKKEAISFCFKMADSEKGYKKMIEYIESETPYSIISQYLENMIAADKNKLIERILRKSDDSGWGRKKDDKVKDAEYFPEMFKLFEKYYGADYLRMAIRIKEKERWYFNRNDFTDYMKEQLGI